MMKMHVGFGYDAHRFAGSGPVVLGGVTIDHAVGIEATSDGDVVAHAVCDALLGAAAQGDIGDMFPSDDPQWHDADSMEMLAAAARKVRTSGYDPMNIDVTVIVEEIRIAPHRMGMRSNIAQATQVPLVAVSVKATTTDGLGWIGSGEGLAAHAVALVQG